MAVETRVRAEWASYPGDGVTVAAYLARPDGMGTWPGIVMIHENPGLTEHRQEVTRLLAAEGYAACIKGEVIKVPGVVNAAGMLASRATPKWVLRRISGALGRKSI